MTPSSMAYDRTERHSRAQHSTERREAKRGVSQLVVMQEDQNPSILTE